MSITNTDMLLVADAVAREKSIEAESVLQAMEEAIEKAGRSKYGHDYDIRANINRITGEIKLTRHTEVVEELENPATQLVLSEAKRIKRDAVIGEFLVDELPPIDFGRIAAQTAKQVIVQKVREAERQRQYNEYKDRVGDVITGTVKRAEYGSVTVDLGKAEGIIRRDEVIPREAFKRGDRVQAYIYDVREEQRGPQIFLSRTHPEYLRYLFTQEVPEIEQGLIKIEAVARDPGSRAKIAVSTYDSTMDPVGACVGMRGNRVQNIVSELQGEKIDVIHHTDDFAQFTMRALAPAEVQRIELDDEEKKIEVVVADDGLSLAIGRRGQNVRLASMLTGWDIDILTEAQQHERREKEIELHSSLFMTALDVDDMIARLLVGEGFRQVEEVAYVPLSELQHIDGFDENIAQELQNRAINFVNAQEAELNERLGQLNLSEDLVNYDGLSKAQLVALGNADVKSLEDFAELAVDELVGEDDSIWKECPMKKSQASDMIMQAREKCGWFADTDSADDSSSNDA